MFNSLASPPHFLQLLKQRLLEPLPGDAAQDKMTSRARLPLETYLENHPDYRSSAVMMLLYPVNGNVHTMIIQRPDYDGIHSGQLALPGGKADEADVSLRQTAMRETQEEVGVIITD